MNSQELELALRERILIVLLIWVDEYGLITWTMDLIDAAGELLPTLRQALPRTQSRSLRAASTTRRTSSSPDALGKSLS